MDPRITKSRDRPVRDNPRFSNFAESGSGLFSAQWLITYLIPVRVFLNELVPRSVLDFSKFSGLGPVLDSSFFSVLDQSILVRRYLATPKQWSDYIQSDNYKIRTIIEIDYGQWFIDVDTTEIKHRNQTIGSKIATNRLMSKFDGFHVVKWC